MKNILFTLITLFCCGLTFGQGLEGIIVDEVYTATAGDELAGGPVEGAITYRVYADLAPGYTFQVLYGVNKPSGDNDLLDLSTSTSFYNNATFGATTPNGIGTAFFGFDTYVSLDSWVSVGAGATGQMGITQANDNAASDVGGSLPSPDGLVAGSPEGVTFVGFGTEIDDAFGSGTSNSVQTTNASIASLNGSTGAGAENHILLGQFTTDGDFTFYLNIQLGAPGGGTENWVAQTPESGEFTMPGLTRQPNNVPTVAITAPADGTNYIAGNNVDVTATADDTDGTVSGVELFLNGTSIGTDNTSPYEFSFPAASSGALTAVATDNGGAMATSAPVNIVVAGNDAPTVSLTVPATAITGDAVTFSATASDTDGSVTQVEFFVDGTSVGVVNTAPYDFSWTSTVGTKVVRATATDDLGATAFDEETIIVANNQGPVVTFTSPADGANVPEGSVTVSATATDPEGESVAQVEFFANGTSIGVDNAAPFEATYTAVYAAPGDVVLTAVATDGRGTDGATATRNISVLNPAGAPYELASIDVDCADVDAANGNGLCIPFSAKAPIDNIIGFDLVVTFDPSLIVPTGRITEYDDLANSNLWETDYTVDVASGTMLISVFFNVGAPLNSKFSGIGDLLCIEFDQTDNFVIGTPVNVKVPRVQESYVTGVVQYGTAALPTPIPVDSGFVSTYKDTTYAGQVVFWQNNSPLAYDESNPNDYLVTTITPSDDSCDELASYSSVPNLTGKFSSLLREDTLNINIDRDFDNAESVQAFVNGFDALQVRRLLIDQLESISIYEILAMDVNLDGVISAGDASQINQRAVLILGEFRQAWNYDATGVSNGEPSKDWMFVDQTTVLSNPAYAMSGSFPESNGVGYSKYSLPVPNFCLALPVTDFNECPNIEENGVYPGYVLGDANGNYANYSADGILRNNNSVVLDLNNAKEYNDIVEVPVNVNFSGDVNSIDLAIKFDSNLTFDKVVYGDDIKVLSHFNQEDQTLRITSNSLKAISKESAFSIRFKSNDEFNSSNIIETESFVNGDKVNTTILEKFASSEDELAMYIYPNPTTGLMNVLTKNASKLEILDLSGRTILVQSLSNSNQQVDLSGAASGMYFVRVSNDLSSTVQKIVLEN